VAYRPVIVSAIGAVNWFLPFDAHCYHIVTAMQHLVPDQVKPSFVIFDIRALLTISPESQSAQMSKLQMTAQPGLAQDALKLYPYGNGGRQRVNW